MIERRRDRRHGYSAHPGRGSPLNFSPNARRYSRNRRPRIGRSNSTSRGSDVIQFVRRTPDRGQYCQATGAVIEGVDFAAARAILQMREAFKIMFLDWTNWTFWVNGLALVAFGFNLRVIYEQWPSRKMSKKSRDGVSEMHDLTQRLKTATERLNKSNADAALKSRLTVAPPSNIVKLRKP